MCGAYLITHNNKKKTETTTQSPEVVSYKPVLQSAQYLLHCNVLIFWYIKSAQVGGRHVSVGNLKLSTTI